MNISDYLQLLGEYNLVALSSISNGSNYTLDLSGRIASPSVTFTGKTSIGENNQYDSKYVVVCNSISITDASICKGAVAYSSSLSKTKDCILDFTPKKKTIIDFNTLKSEISSYSTLVSNMSQSGTKRYSQTVYSFNSSNDFTIINLSSSDLANFNTASVLKFSGSENSTIIINAPSSNIILNNKAYEYVGIKPTNVFLNTSSSTVSITGDCKLNIIAPNASVSIISAKMYSQVIGKTITLSDVTWFEYYSNIPGLLTSILPKPVLTYENEYNNTDAVVSFTSNYTVWCSVDNGQYSICSGDLTVTGIGTHTVSFYATSPGYVQSELSTIEFKITCQCDSPTITRIDNSVLVESITSGATILVRQYDDSNYIISEKTIQNNSQYDLEQDGKYVLSFTVKAVS